MKILNVLILSLAGFAMNAYSATIVPQDSLVCSKFINEWGHANRCACPKPSRYDERLGSCVQGSYESITVSGQIVAGVMAIGGETTGILLKPFEQGAASYELILKNVDFQKLSTLNGLPFEVEGDLILLEGVETASRPAIIVKALRWLE